MCNEETICGNCRHNKYDRQTKDFVCNNQDGEYYGLSTSYDDMCDEYEEKEENKI